MKVMKVSNPWFMLPQKSNSYVLAIDENVITNHNSKANAKVFFYLDLLPEPFIGNKNAPIVLLNNNPGYDLNDKIFHALPYFRKYIFRNLKHQSKIFYPLESPFLKSPVSEWWMKKLHILIEDTSIQLVSRNLFVIEAMGYHSIKFQDIQLLSQSYTKFLVRRAIKRDASIIIMRGKKYWFSIVPDLVNYKKCEIMKNCQNPSFSPGNLSGYHQYVNILNNQRLRRLHIYINIKISNIIKRSWKFILGS